MTEQLQQTTHNFLRLLKASSKPVFLTGAGISTESGIPDFRGKDGYWKTNTPIMFQDFVDSEATRLKSWRRTFSRGSVFTGAVPNITHEAISYI